MERPPNAEGETPEQQGPPDEQAGGERPVPAEAPRRVRPQEEAPAEALDQRGAALLQVLQRVGDPYVVGFGGKGELPWIEVRPQNLVEVARRFRDHRELQMRMLHCLLAVGYVDMEPLKIPHHGARLPFTDASSVRGDVSTPREYTADIPSTLRPLSIPDNEPSMGTSTG